MADKSKRIVVAIKGEAAEILRRLAKDEERDHGRQAAYCIREYAKRSGARCEEDHAATERR